MLSLVLGGGGLKKIELIEILILSRICSCSSDNFFIGTSTRRKDQFNTKIRTDLQSEIFFSSEVPRITLPLGHIKYACVCIIHR